MNGWWCVRDWKQWYAACGVAYDDVGGGLRMIDHLLALRAQQHSRLLIGSLSSTLVISSHCASCSSQGDVGGFSAIIRG